MPHTTSTGRPYTPARQSHQTDGPVHYGAPPGFIPRTEIRQTMNPQSQTCVNLSRLYGTIANWDNFTKKNPDVFIGIFLYNPFRLHYGPGVDSASNRNEYQVYRRPLRKCNNLTTILCCVMKSGNLNFLEPSGPLQACNATALPFLFLIQLRGKGQVHIPYDRI